MRDKFKIVIVYDSYTKTFSYVKEVLKNSKIPYDAIYEIQNLKDRLKNIQIYLVDFSILMHVTS